MQTWASCYWFTRRPGGATEAVEDLLALVLALALAEHASDRRVLAELIAVFRTKDQRFEQFVDRPIEERFPLLQAVRGYAPGVGRLTSLKIRARLPDGSLGVD